MELALRMDMARTHFERKSQRAALIKWLDWIKSHQRRRAAYIDRLQTLVNAFRLKRILAAWLAVAKDSQRTKEYFKRLELSVTEFSSKDQQTPRPPGERVDGVSVLPHHLSLKIFQYLEIRDWLNCAEVCCAWKSIVHSGTLWSQINFSVGKDWITDSTVQQILQSYRPFVTRLNLRGCTSLKWSSLKYISECRNLQELNMSECLVVSDMMIQRITEGCPCLLYLNLSSTLVTDHSLKAIFRNCLSLQYLSLAHCRRFTDEGFLCLTTEKGGRNLTHLNLSECSQMTANGFRYISAGCLSLTEVVINDMPTLSDSCVLALLTSCYCLSSVSLLWCPNLSDVALKAIAKASNLKFFSIEGNNQITDVSWRALCSHSQGLCRLQAADCPGMTDDSLRYVASLKNLKYLDISLCSKVSDAGIKCLTDGSSTNELHHLSISRCCLVTDNSVRRIARRLRKLYHLNLSYCERLTDPAVELLSGSSICSLDMSGCNIQDQGLAALQRVHLKKIVLAECVNITDTGIEKLCKNTRDLEHVDVSHCVALSDAAIRAVSFYCRGLLTLRMSGCPKMTDMAVLYLTSGSQYLRELDISGCTLLTDRSLRHLKRICPPLTSIRMTCCSSISWAAAIKLQARVSHWEYRNFNPSSCFDGSANQ
ncbi:dynein regulatory complex subunit 6 isoform X1 [Fundulus heteroclitus]|uniref:dynein regulatory complex subunit 6 isoform X1 n=1 Tax=Fundulus heteroclitus TaxID=8078 RepID=UPI00165ABBAB|nr:dynein regulatory complex subunit 6 isoform X1 [Fundulus heteroclitus]XP_036006721.1 dynein regulatory complex subunit 6 isoform X1 [Fundulus heteroclitus]XP_036006728.1 dynein regulatory complex subunit 6 isoform X1 [Fundulus heteroclitus]